MRPSHYLARGKLLSECRVLFARYMIKKAHHAGTAAAVGGAVNAYTSITPGRLHAAFEGQARIWQRLIVDFEAHVYLGRFLRLEMLVATTTRSVRIGGGGLLRTLIVKSYVEVVGARVRVDE